MRREDDPSQRRIIDELRRHTDIATVINTCFNMHQEPIVCSPADAVRAPRLGRLDYLAIGDFLATAPPTGAARSGHADADLDRGRRRLTG